MLQHKLLISPSTLNHTPTSHFIFLTSNDGVKYLQICYVFAPQMHTNCI